MIPIYSDDDKCLLLKKEQEYIESMVSFLETFNSPIAIACRSVDDLCVMLTI